MTDQQIIQGLIERDNKITQEFFFERCRSLFYAIIRHVFSYEVDYDEFVNELYIYLMENDAARLRQFEGRSTLYQWIKVTAIRFFIKKRDRLIEDTTKEPLIDEVTLVETHEYSAAADVERMLAAMPNRRYAYVIRKLMVDELSPDELAAIMHITTDNLYNLKRRAMAQLMQVALKDIRNYGKK